MTDVAQASAQLSPAIPPSYFGPSSAISPVLLPNPVNPTCQVLIFIKTLSTTNSSQQNPTAEQVASSVTTRVDYQCENLNSTDTPVSQPLSSLPQLNAATSFWCHFFSSIVSSKEVLDAWSPWTVCLGGRCQQEGGCNSEPRRVTHLKWLALNLAESSRAHETSLEEPRQHQCLSLH